MSCARRHTLGWKSGGLRSAIYTFMMKSWGFRKSMRNYDGHALWVQVQAAERSTTLAPEFVMTPPQYLFLLICQCGHSSSAGMYYNVHTTQQA